MASLAAIREGEQAQAAIIAARGGSEAAGQTARSGQNDLPAIVQQDGAQGAQGGQQSQGAQQGQGVLTAEELQDKAITTVDQDIYIHI
jgi:hypothetical protein